MTKIDTAMTTGQAQMLLDEWYSLTDATKDAVIVTLLRHLMSQSLVLHDTQ
jgi:hypothetical protein